MVEKAKSFLAIVLRVVIKRAHIHSLTLFHEACEDCIWLILHQKRTDTYFGAQNSFKTHCLEKKKKHFN